MNDLSVITVLFDYPQNALPLFHKNVCKYVSQSNIFVARFNENLKLTRYQKLYKYKICELIKFLEENIKSKFTLFLDANDTNVIKNPLDYINSFEQKSCSIIFGAEKGLWPNTKYNGLYQHKTAIGDSKYLNSGTYLGYTESIISHLKNIKEKNYLSDNVDDQGHWAAEYLHSQDIVLDYKREFFFSTFDSKELVDTHEKDYGLKTKAFVVHDNGPQTNNTIKLANYFNK